MHMIESLSVCNACRQVSGTRHFIGEQVDEVAVCLEGTVTPPVHMTETVVCHLSDGGPSLVAFSTNSCNFFRSTV